MAHLCLPNSVLRVGVDFSRDPVVIEAIASAGAGAALLFPGPTAVDIGTAPPPLPGTLIVVDGTWSQAASLVRRNPILAALPRYRLSPAQPSTYRIRREPEAHCVATIEALAEVLGVLEGDPSRFAKLRAPFDAMVENQLRFAATVRGGRLRHRRVPRSRRPRPVPSVLCERPDRVVLAYGEANAWAYDTVGAPTPEIVHWVAVRLGTGDRFESVIAPRGSMAPSLERHTGLARERIAAGEAHDQFAARWAEFAGANDVVTTWGSYAVDVLASRGVERGEWLDLRAATSSYLGTRTGTMESCAARWERQAAAPWAAGRAGRRIQAMWTIAMHLRLAAGGASDR